MLKQSSPYKFLPGSLSKMIALVTALPLELALLAKDWHLESLAGKYYLKTHKNNGSIDLCILATGIGIKRAKEAVTALLEQYPVSCLISTGFAGGLSPLLKHGDLLIADKVTTPMLQEKELIYANDEILSIFKNNYAPIKTKLHCGTLITGEQIAKTAEEKLGLLRFGIGIDMETGAMAAIAKELNIPWGAVRAITDTYNETLPLDFKNYQTVNGYINHKKIIAHFVMRPWLWKYSMKLGARAKIASQELTVFWQAIIPKLTKLY